MHPTHRIRNGPLLSCLAGRMIREEPETLSHTNLTRIPSDNAASHSYLVWMKYTPFVSASGLFNLSRYLGRLYSYSKECPFGDQEFLPKILRGSYIQHMPKHTIWSWIGELHPTIPNPLVTIKDFLYSTTSLTHACLLVVYSSNIRFTIRIDSYPSLTLQVL